MNLDAWLRQDHSLADQLKVIEGLCSALNDAHKRGTVHRSLEPSKIEVQSDGTCVLTEAMGGTPSPRYRAPEIAEGAGHSPQADIYSAGVIIYEMLSGKSPSEERPTPLSDLRPDVSRDLTDAIMGCLEKGPDWRPKDLSYLLQVVGSLRSPGGRQAPRPSPRAAEAPRMPTVKPRRSTGPASRSNVPLLAAVLVLMAGAGVGAWFWLHSQAPGTPVAPPASPPPATLAPTPEPSKGAGPSPGPSLPTPKPTPSPKKLASPEPVKPEVIPVKP
ncbi:MAG TPA: hypothetical protein VKI41_12500, partial [Vicinamibacteria bacterium]|nr:hypothetical protein [Vicinamibacteria bacterium]